MVICRPVFESVRRARSGQSAQTRLNSARAVCRSWPRLGRIVMETRFGQVTVPASRSMVNWSLPDNEAKKLR
jgi:hypothetical protein